MDVSNRTWTRDGNNWRLEYESNGYRMAAVCRYEQHRWCGRCTVVPVSDDSLTSAATSFVDLSATAAMVRAGAWLEAKCAELTRGVCE